VNAFCPRSTDDTTHTPVERMTTYAQWYDTIKRDLHTHLANTSTTKKPTNAAEEDADDDRLAMPGRHPPTRHNTHTSRALTTDG